MAQAPFRTAALTASGDVAVGSAFTLTAANGNLATTGTLGAGAATVTSLDASSGGITNAGAIAGATTVTASGDITSSAGNVSAVDGSFSGAITGASLDAGAGSIVTTGTADLGATTVDSLDASSGGITNAGSIAGATTINLSSTLTGGGDGIFSGNVQGADGTFTGSVAGASFSTAGDITTSSGDITATVGTVTAATLTDGAFSTTAGAVTGVTTLAMNGALSGVSDLTASDTIDFSGATSFTLGGYTLPTIDGSPGYVLKTDGAGVVSWGIDAATSAGSAGNIQFNDGSNGFAADASLNWDTTNDILELGNGGSVYAGLASNSQSVAGGAINQSVDTFSQSDYASAKYLLHAENTSSGETQSTELLITADGSTTMFVPFADVFSGAGPLFNISVSGTATVSVDITNVDPANAISVQFMRTTLA